MTHKHDGQWLIGGKRKVIYGATRLPFAERVKAAQALVEQEHRWAARAAARKAGTRPQLTGTKHQTTNLGVRSSNLFGRAISI